MRIAGLLFVAAAVFGSQLGAQALPPECNPALVQVSRSASLPHGYAPRGAYCDGQVVVPSSGTFLLLSVEMGGAANNGSERIMKTAAGTGPIRLRLPPLPPGNPAELSVHGEQLERGGNWRLDGRMTASGLDVDRSAALAPMELDENKIGFVAKVLPARQLIVPVVVAGRPAALVWLIVRAPAPLRVVWLDVAGGSRSAYSRPVAHDVGSGQVLRIPLDAENSADVRSVKLSASGAGTERYALSLSLLVPAGH